MTELPSEYVGWWRITETSQWANEYLDDLGPALISITGRGDRPRMLALLAVVPPLVGRCARSKSQLDTVSRKAFVPFEKPFVTFRKGSHEFRKRLSRLSKSPKLLVRAPGLEPGYLAAQEPKS
jgi:hypothetical protein